MKRITSILLTMVMTITIILASVFPASANASSEISPYLSNSNSCATSFGIDDSGMACVVVSYAGRQDVFTQAKVTVTLEKKFLLLFWQSVDIEGSSEWVGYCSDLNGVISKEFSVEDTGTYRATFYIEIYGTSGVTDVMEDTIEAKY